MLLFCVLIKKNRVDNLSSSLTVVKLSAAGTGSELSLSCCPIVLYCFFPQQSNISLFLIKPQIVVTFCLPLSQCYDFVQLHGAFFFWLSIG